MVTVPLFMVSSKASKVPGWGEGRPVAVMASLVQPKAGVASSARKLPCVFMDTVVFYRPVGRTIVVTATGDFQAALNHAKPGDLITLGANLDAIAAATNGVAIR